MFSNASTCMIYHLHFLINTPTIRDMNSQSSLTLRDIYRFAAFVAPDGLMRQLTGHPDGSPADIKSFYTRFENDNGQGVCIELFGQPHGRDVPGNLAFGYIGSHAGFSPLVLLGGAGIAQALDDIRTGSAVSSVDFASDFGDSPEDQVAAEMGIVLYRLCGSFCTSSDIETVLTIYRSQYVRAAQQSNRATCRPVS
jgi:hypothetical protein